MTSSDSLPRTGPGAKTSNVANSPPRLMLAPTRDANIPPILTIKEVAQVLRCSKAHIVNAINGHVKGLPRLTHFSLGRRKLIRREWLEQWIDANKTRC